MYVWLISVFIITSKMIRGTTRTRVFVFWLEILFSWFVFITCGFQGGEAGAETLPRLRLSSVPILYIISTATLYCHVHNKDTQNGTCASTSCVISFSLFLIFPPSCRDQTAMFGSVDESALSSTKLFCTAEGSLSFAPLCLKRYTA